MAAAIIEGLAMTNSAPRLAHSGEGYYLRVCRPYSFRALIGRGEGPLPAVITILRSGNGRGGRRERERRKNAETACDTTAGEVD